jgi:NAD(P)-dependent dehydrogenase (short-subunit alcohol dehydrogenase family)
VEIAGVAALVSGGASGLGLATAVALAEAGAKVTLLDINGAAAKTAANELGGIGLPCDVTNADATEAAVAAARSRHGPARIVVNCAGIGRAGRIVDRDGKPMPLEQFRQVVEVNLIGSFNLLRVAAADMTGLDPLADGERGVILLTASVAAYDGQIGQVAYSASKGGIVGLTLPAAREMSRYGIRVMAIAPGVFATPMLAGLPADTTVTATFNPPVTLTVTEVGTGAGQVTSSPAGITCSVSSNQCAAPFAVGTQVTLTASASAGSTFAGWSGGGCSGTSTCQVTMSAAQSVTATFNVIPSFMLAVAPTGGGAGTVTSSPSGINCGATCNASFQQGTQVTLSATTASGSTFGGWSGGGCSGDQSCAVTITANTTVVATFIQNTAANLTLVAAVLPTSRSVQVGTTATAFATMIDAGPADAVTCTIAPQTGIPASFVFQTTNPATNALTGTANTPANIAAGQAQSFVIALSPTAAFAPTNVAFTFTCANAPGAAATNIGVDTLNLSASTTPVPDVVALAASGDPGYVDIPGATGTGVFAVATVNLGIDAAITAAANTGTANLPVILTICQTNPTSGACLATPAPSVTTDIPPNATPTFGIFVAGSAAVANLPGVNRVFVTFTDSGGTLRGETSVAVRTQ